MPTDQEFIEFEMSMNGNGIGYLEPIRPYLDARFPAKEDREAYYNWSRSRGIRMRQNEVTPVTRSELAKLIDRLNYNDQLQRAQLISSIHKNVVPWFHAGTDDHGDVYRIVPEPYGLIADQPLPETDQELISPNVLGVNVNVQPLMSAYRRESDISSHSENSNESDDPNPDGFVFHQLGTIEMYDGPINKITEEIVSKGPWSPTNFRAVMRIQQNGTREGIYIMYDFYPVDEDTGRRPSERTENPRWGVLGQIPHRMAVARIADSMSELEYDRAFKPDVTAGHPVEIVRVALGPGNTMHRFNVVGGRG